MSHIKFLSIFSRPVSFIKNEIGSVTIEFALLVPLIMIPLYVGMVDLTTAFMAKRKLTMAVYQTANVLAQHDKLTVSQVTAILEAGKSTMYPLNETKFKSKYSLLKLTPSGSTVVWSYGDAPRTVNANVNVEQAVIDLFKNGNLQNVLYSESTYESQSTLLSFLKIMGLSENYKLTETYYTRPRIGETITIIP